MCWFCAHAVTEHGATLDNAGITLCHCPAEDVFPEDVLARRRPADRVLTVTAESGAELELHARHGAMSANFGAPPRSTRVPAKVRQAQASAAASKTAPARLARRRAEVHADRSEPADLPEPERHGVDRVVAVGN